MIEIFPRRDVTQGECLADHILLRRAHAPYALNENIAQTALEQLGGERGGAGVLEVLQRFAGDHVGAIGDLCRTEDYCIVGGIMIT